MKSKTVGLVLVFIGLILLIYSFFMRVSLEGSSVVNLNLLNTRQNILILSLFVILIGAIVFLASRFSKEEDTSFSIFSLDGIIAEVFNANPDEVRLYKMAISKIKNWEIFILGWLFFGFIVSLFQGELFRSLPFLGLDIVYLLYLLKRYKLLVLKEISDISEAKKIIQESIGSKEEISEGSDYFLSQKKYLRESFGSHHLLLLDNGKIAYELEDIYYIFDDMVRFRNSLKESNFMEASSEAYDRSFKKIK
jgi:hypothetical protein